MATDRVVTSHDTSQPVSDGDCVILHDHRKNCFTVRVRGGSTVKICKQILKLDLLIGCNYGQAFTFRDGRWTRVAADDPLGTLYRESILQDETGDESESDLSSPTGSSTDNRNVLDNNTSQKLSHDEIVAIKQQVNAQDLIATIVNNSETFRTKNRMSKEKYIARKEARHLKWFRVMHCDVFTVCESYFNSFPHKIGYLNPVSLGMMLFLANIKPHDNVFVFDHSLGLLTGAVAQRLDGTGKLFRLVTKGVSDKILHELGVRYFDNILSVDFEKIFEIEDSRDSPTLPEGVKRPRSDVGLYPLANVSRAQLMETNVLIGNISFNKCDKKNAIVSAYSQKLLQIADVYLESGSMVVLYGQQHQSMYQCQAALSLSSMYVNVKLEEVFIREYQIESQRTHPFMQFGVRPFCGFLLSATKVTN